MVSVLDPSALPQSTPAVTYDTKSEIVTLPSGVVSVAGITVITGGNEMSWGSCMLAFGFWGTLIGLSTLSVGLWDKSAQKYEGISVLLLLGLVVLAISSSIVLGVFGFRSLIRQKRKQPEEGKVMLVGVGKGRDIKTVTV